MSNISTFEEVKGVICRFRISSENTNLRSIYNLSPVKLGMSLSDNEIGFESNFDRNSFINYLKTL